MRTSCFFSLASLVAGFSLATAEDLPNRTWIVSDVRRIRSPDNSRCSWSFLINATENPQPLVFCQFDVLGTENVPCHKNDFSNIRCTDGVTKYKIGGGWSPQQFVVMNIVDTKQSIQAWFGWADTELDGNQPIPQQAKTTEPFTPPTGSLFARRDDGTLPLESADMWEIKYMKRDVQRSRSQLLYMAFSIQDIHSQKVSCDLYIQGPENTDLTTWSWHNHSCSASQWSASWRYTPDDNSGVLTVVNPTRNRRASFGFHNANQTSYFGSAGLSTVKECDCA